jgi:hypothetical protein
MPFYVLIPQSVKMVEEAVIFIPNEEKIGKTFVGYKKLKYPCSEM